MKESTSKAIGSIASALAKCVTAIATAYGVVRCLTGPVITKTTKTKDGTEKTIEF